VLYLRALGARIGKRVVIFSPTVVCTDLLTIGDGTVIRKGAALSCYRAHAGLIETGSVALGKEVVVSEATVLDIDTSVGDRAQLGHASSLHSGQAVPADERWHGSPAQRTEVDYRAVPPTDCGALRRVLYPLSQLLGMVLVSLPVAIAGPVVLVAEVPQIPALLDGAHLTPAGLSFYLEALVASLLLLFGGLLLGLLVVGSVPRLLNLAIRPEKVYRLFGIHYFLHRTIARLTNVRIFTYLFGDSFLIVHYLRYIGYDLGKVVQTGSNFSTGVIHESPYASAVGTGTVVADGLWINNADYSSTSFRVSQTTIGANNFLGNNVAFPTRTRTGDDCLLATKVMVPIDGKVREGVGLLGSPSFEIPRSVLRDTSLELESNERRRRLVRKNWHNLRTLALALLVRWMHLFVLTVGAMLVADLYRRFGIVALIGEFVAFTLFTLAYLVFVERASTGFRPIRPQYCSIYDPYFWWHERFWKLAVQRLERLFAGTPFKPLLLRLLGVRLGKKVFDDGCAIPEKTLVSIGDYCTLNAGTVIQGHSQEDGAFKSDYITIGSGCTVGVGAWVHYGVTMGDGVVLAPDSFLMKGEQVPPHAHWGGNPAEERPSSGAEPRSLTAATTGPSPEKPWSWDLDGALLPTAPRENGKQIQLPSPEEQWSWDLDGALLRTDSGRTSRQIGPPVPVQAWSWDVAGAAPAASSGPEDSKPVPLPADWHGTPAQARPGSAGSPSRAGTLVRRSFGLVAVLFLVVSAVAFYRESPGFSTSGAVPSTPSAVPVPSPSAGPTSVSEPSRPTPTRTPAADRTGSPSTAGARAIQLETSTFSAKPFQTVRISGVYRGGADTLLQLQRREAGRWLAFPLPSKADRSGKFTAFVEFGQPGRYQLRVLDPTSGVTSNAFVLVIER
jgi:non-ribosomal peptide synthetase-like protein